MEGYPLHSNDLCYTGYSQPTYSSIDSMGTLDDAPYDLIVNIKEEMIQALQEDFTKEFNLDSEDTEYLGSLISSFREFMIKLDDQEKVLQKVESKMKQTVAETQKNIKTIETFITFLGQINNNDTEIATSIKEKLESIIETMQSSQDIEKVRDEFIREKKKYFHYLRFVKFINQMNLGSTCSICLSKNVDVYFNPCGHTACSSCADKTMSSTSRCPLCRKNVLQHNKLYFT